MRKQTTPQNIAEQIRSTLQGTVYANDMVRGKIQLREFSFPFGKYPKDVSTSPFLSEYVNSTVKGGDVVSREWAESRWAASIALAIHYISGHEVYSGKPMKELRSARAILNKAPWNTDEHRTAQENFHKAWQSRFDPTKNSKAILNQTVEAQARLLGEFVDTAPQLGCVDSETLFRLESLIKENITAFNNGAKEKDLVKANTDSVRKDLYQLMLTDVYQSNAQSAPHLAERMLKVHLPELQQFADAQKYAGSKKTLDFDINIASYVDGANISINGSKVGGISDKFHNSGDKRSEWTVSAGFKQFDETGYVALTSKISLVGRDSSDITFTPDFRGWLEMLPHSPSGTEAALSTDLAKNAYVEKQNALNEQIEKSILESEKKHAERLERLKQQAEERRIKVNSLIEQNYDLPLVTKESVKGTQLEKKHITELLDYPELHGLFRHSSLHDIPAVSIQMGLDPETTRGLQYLADPPYLWGKEDKTNKMFEVMTDDMKNNFVQLGDVTPNSTIISAEGVATAGALYIAAKRKELDVVVVASMFAFNIKYALEHYKNTYPNNPLINAADNDCWRKVANENGNHDLRAIKDNAGVRVGLELQDEFGVKSFGPNWADDSIFAAASKVKATDFNDFFEIYEYEEALSHIGQSIEAAMKDSPTPISKVTPSQKFTQSAPGDYESVFDAFELDENLQTGSFVAHDFKEQQAHAQSQDNAITEPLAPINDEPVKEQPTPEKTAAGYELQRLRDGEWQAIETGNNAEEILIKQDTEKRYAVEDAYANLVESEATPEVAFSKSLAFVESTYRCFDRENDTPFTSAETFNDTKDRKLENAVVLLIENEAGVFTRPIRIDAEGSYVIGGKKTNEQPRYTGRNEIAQTIKSVLDDLYFNETGSYDWVTEEHFILRTLDENGKPDRNSSRTFNTEFNCNVEQAQRELLNPDTIDVKFLNDVELINVTCSTTDEKQPIKMVEVNKHELAYEIDQLKKDPSIIDIDAGSITATDLSFNIAQQGASEGPLVVKSYAPNGLVNGTYVLDNLNDAEDKISSLNATAVVIPTTLFMNSANGLAPIKTGLDPISIGLLPPVTPENDLTSTPNAEIDQYLENLTTESIVNTALPEFKSDESITLQNNTWHSFDIKPSALGPATPTFLPEESLAQLNDGLIDNDEIDLTQTADQTGNSLDASTDNDVEFANNLNSALSKDEVPTIDFDEEELAYLEASQQSYSEMANDGALDSMIFDSSNTFDPDVDLDSHEPPATLSVPEGFTPEEDLSKELDSISELDSEKEPAGLDSNAELEYELSEEERNFQMEDLSERDVLFDEFNEDLDLAVDDFIGDLGLSEPEVSQTTVEEEVALTSDVDKHSDNQIDLLSLADSAPTSEEIEHDKENQAQDESTLNKLKSSAVSHANNIASLMTNSLGKMNALNRTSEQNRKKEVEATHTTDSDITPENDQLRNDNAESLVGATVAASESVLNNIESNIDAGGQDQNEIAENIQQSTGNTLVNEILKQLTDSPIKYEKTFEVSGSWSTSSTSLNQRGGYSVDADNFAVKSELTVPADKIVKTDVNRPSTQSLKEILERSKLKAWKEKVTSNSVQSQVELFAKQAELNEQSNALASQAAALENDLPLPSNEIDLNTLSQEMEATQIEPNELVQNEQVQEPNLSATETETENVDHSTALPSTDITKQLELVLELLKSGELGSGELSNVLTNYSKVQNRVDAQTPSSHQATSSLQAEQSRKPEPSSAQHSKANEQTAKVNQVNQDLPINEFWEFDYEGSDSAHGYIAQAEELVGDKGNSAILKKASFLMTASTDPDADINTLAQNAITIMAEMSSPETDLVKQEYTAAAREIANWLDSTAKVGLLIESTRNEAGYVDKFSSLPQHLKDKVHEYLVNPVNEIKKTDEPIFKSWMCIKDSIEKRQIPQETMRQALLGAWNTQPRQGRHTAEYASVNGKLRKGIDKFTKKAVEAGLIFPSPIDNAAWAYTDPIDKSEKTITKSDLKFKTAALVAESEVQAAIDIPRNAKKWARQDIGIQAGQVFQEMTSIPSPFGQLPESKHSYMPPGRRLEGSKKHNDQKKEMEVDIS